MSNVRSGLRTGLVAGVVNVFAVLLGVPGLVGRIVAGWLGLPSPRFGAWAWLLLVAIWAGVRAIRKSDCQSWGEASVTGLLSSACQGLLSAAFTGLMASLVSGGVDVRKVLAQISPEAMDLLTFGRAPGIAALIIFAVMTVVGFLGTVVSFASACQGWRESVMRGWFTVRQGVVHSPVVQSVARFEYLRHILYGVGLVILLGSPFVLGQYWNYTLGTVGIYVILGLGLNVVVGMGGLLNLGYAAFFAIGGYTVAILTGPQFGIEWSFWVALPIGIVLATLTGVLLSIPVLRMRGDYLAIVTMGFGEIIRILAKSDVLTDFTGGPRGVRDVAGPMLFGADVSSELHFMYFILLAIVLAVFVMSRLQNSRLGRALMAMREDEDVAQATGVYTLKYKVLAFAIGAAFAGLGGVIFVSRNQFTGPEDYALLVSINVLCLVIIGGMNSVPGIVLGALVLKGLPEMLRDLDDYRMVVFGLLLVAMMILRPEGLWPSTRGGGTLRRESAGPQEQAVVQGTGGER